MRLGTLQPGTCQQHQAQSMKLLSAELEMGSTHLSSPLTHVNRSEV